MRRDKTLAINLRKEGNSYKQIAAQLNIPKSTLSEWLSKSQWSLDIKNRLAESTKKTNSIRLKNLNKIRGRNLQKIYKAAEAEARTEYLFFKKDLLFMAGLVSYWGEGDKRTNSIVRITNTDSDMLKIFTKFLLQICGVPKENIKAYILLYPDLEKDLCLDYWSKNLEILKSNFNKCIVIQGRHKKNRLSYGICTVFYNSAYLKRKILLWIKLISKQLLQKNNPI